MSDIYQYLHTGCKIKFKPEDCHKVFKKHINNKETYDRLSNSFWTVFDVMGPTDENETNLITIKLSEYDPSHHSYKVHYFVRRVGQVKGYFSNHV